VTVKPFQGKISLDVRDSLPDWAALRLSGFHPAATVLGHPHLRTNAGAPVALESRLPS